MVDTKGILTERINTCLATEDPWFIKCVPIYVLDVS